MSAKPPVTGKPTWSKLHVRDDRGRQVEVNFGLADTLGIGRDPTNVICLEDRDISRNHARIVWNGERLYVEDLGSYNGVRVNGTRIRERTEIDHNDRIEIGAYLMWLEPPERGQFNAPTVRLEKPDGLD